MRETDSAVELNLDGLVGPTHLYGALSTGNRASMLSGGSQSNPREAALQGLAKMQYLADLGVPQAVLPPQERPDLETLARLGFSGAAATVLRRAARDALPLLRACSSASSMWAANAATTTPSADARDGRVHFTPANLVTNLHRAIEAPATSRLLRAIFPDPAFFAHHPPLPSAGSLSDEGAANHMRLCSSHGARGLHVFVFGRRGIGEMAASAATVQGDTLPGRFPARQTEEASEAVARSHQLRAGQVLFLQQDSEAIDQGVFHNDVIATANQSFLLYHERAFVDADRAVEAMRRRYTRLCQGELRVHRVSTREMSLAEAVKSYLFNSQIVQLSGGGMLLLAANECRESPAALGVLEQLIEDPISPIEQVEYIDLNQSMRNGGGPACLRLRVVLTQEEFQQVHAPVLLTRELYQRLREWVVKHYRDRLAVDDLGDPQLLREGQAALEELTQLLQLGTLYRFQQ
jgi:succinylarginine dihydrolase